MSSVASNIGTSEVQNAMAKGSTALSPMPGGQFLSKADYVPPTRHAPRKAIGWLTVNGHREPVYEPVQGFKHLFVQETAPWSPPASEPREVQPRDTTITTHQPVLNRSSRGVKRNRHNEGKLAPDTFNVGNIEALKAFYEARFRELTMKPMRVIVTAWVKRLEPKRQQLYGPYLRNSNSPGSHTEKSKRPPWWPATVPYTEPSHLKLQDLVPLAVDIMLVHRRVDEAAGKRKHASWIAKLETDALYIICSTDLDSFSSSTGSKYNKAMKKRALEEILPSLFNIARCHEDYMAQYKLYEGYNEDPGYGKQIYWQPASRLKREKRPCTTGDIRNDATEVDPEESVYNIQSLDRTPVQTPNTNPPVDAGQSTGRLPLSEIDSSTIPSTFEIPTSSTNGASLIPSYIYPQQMAQGRFHTLATVAPQDVINLPTNRLPVSGISTHSMPTHGLPAFSMPYISSYNLSMPNLPTHGPLADGPPTDEASSHEPPICLPYNWRFAQAL